MTLTTVQSAPQPANLETGEPDTGLVANRLTARRIWLAFLVTFVAARRLVLLTMARKLPDFFLDLGGKLQRIDQQGPR